MSSLGNTAQQFAQKLNNHAAFCIETGRFDEAVPMLIKALKVVEQNSKINNNTIDNSNDNGTNSNEETGCPCKYCSLEQCLTFSGSLPRRYRTKTPSEAPAQGRRYIHRQPIRTTPQSFQKGHSMGVALQAILTFNLALSFHLSAIMDVSSTSTSSRSTPQTAITRIDFQRVLTFYELAYTFQTEEQESDTQVASVRFTMMIVNNLGEIHRVAGNHSKYIMCLQQLLSTMMFVVDCTNHDHEQQDPIELEGFSRNAFQLILREHCAGAA